MFVSLCYFPTSPSSSSQHCPLCLGFWCLGVYNCEAGIVASVGDRHISCDNLDSLINWFSVTVSEIVLGISHCQFALMVKDFFFSLFFKFSIVRCVILNCPQFCFVIFFFFFWVWWFLFCFLLIIVMVGGFLVWFSFCCYWLFGCCLREMYPWLAQNSSNPAWPCLTHTGIKYVCHIPSSGCFWHLTMEYWWKCWPVIMTCFK